MSHIIDLPWLYETLQLEIIGVIESLGQLRESPEYALWQISEKKAGVLDELAAERAKALEKESAELQKEAEQANAECGVRNAEWPGRRLGASGNARAAGGEGKTGDCLTAIYD